MSADNRPKKGDSILVDPIRGEEHIEKIRTLLANNPRDLCLFNFGINTGCRAGELLSLKISDVSELQCGHLLKIKQSKNKQHRFIYPNHRCIEALDLWLAHHPDPSPDAPLFRSTRLRRQSDRFEALTVSSLTRLVKQWCREIGLNGNYGSHSLRKTFGYMQRTKYDVALSKLTKTFGHSSEMQTMRYIGIMPDEIQGIYAHAI